MKSHLKASAVVAIFILVFLGLYSYLSGRPVASSSHIEAVQQMEKNGVPTFSTQTIEGEKIELSAKPGKLVIVNFWASWCGPCIEEIPSLVKLAEHFKDRIEILAISNDEKIEDIQVFMKSFSKLKAANIKIIWDQNRNIADSFKVQRLPESFIVRTSGKLEKKIIGSIGWYTPQSIEYIESVLKRVD
ncbi:MAG: TlpA disulfide reductase family protein [Bdellovibrionota bacterium]